jgi:hypothetical protein
MNFSGSVCPGSLNHHSVITVALSDKKAGSTPFTAALIWIFLPQPDAILPWGGRPTIHDHRVGFKRFGVAGCEQDSLDRSRA